MTFKKLRKYIVASHNKGCVILNVCYRLCFTKVCGMWDIFDKNSFTLGMIQFPWEYLFFFVGSMLRASYKKSLQKQFSFGSDSRKAVNRRVPDISSYCSISNSTACSTLWIFFIVPKNKHLYFHRTHLVVPFMLHCVECLSEEDFIKFYIDIRGILRSQDYSRHFIDFFHRNLILCNAIS